jgi:hypothetical protein
MVFCNLLCESVTLYLKRFIEMYFLHENYMNATVGCMLKITAPSRASRFTLRSEKK